MRKFLAIATLTSALVAPAAASAFHHVALPSTVCANPAAVSPGNNNGMAKEAISTHNPAQALPLPPVGTPGNGQGKGGEHCAGAADE